MGEFPLCIYVPYCMHDDYNDEALYHSIVCGAVKEEHGENVRTACSCNPYNI